MAARERIIEFIKNKGPVLPVHVSKEIGTNILIASAHLSELSSNKQLKVSSVKVGGSPLYYLSGQESRLQNFSSYLHEKEKKTYDLLKEKKILRDKDIDPLSRATIRQIKDFAVPLQVNYKGNVEVFWRWYLLPTEEAEKAIREIIKGPEPEKPAIKREEAKKEIVREKRIEKPEKARKQQLPKIDFIGKITDYFNKNKIEIIEKNILRKNSEIEFIIKVPSSVGALTYFCKAKNKKRINDGDLSSTFIQSQSKKLPVLFLTTGELTKKAKEMAEKEFKGIYIKNI